MLRIATWKNPCSFALSIPFSQKGKVTLFTVRLSIHGLSQPVRQNKTNKNKNEIKRDLRKDELPLIGENLLC
jgi:hypothetical protein